jgi:dolichyl-phosphate beta-glucosyltransferase
MQQQILRRLTQARITLTAHCAAWKHCVASTGYNAAMPALSVVIPAYNEETRLPLTLSSVHGFFTAAEMDIELIVVNDGSKDNTVQVVEDFAKHHAGVRLISYEINKGKGHAVKVGVLASHGDLVLVDDADGNAPIEEFVRLRDAIDSGADVAIGSRAKPNTNTVVKALAYRTFIGNTFNRIVQALLLPGIYDSQCGFKVFKRQAAHDIFAASLVNGYAFDVEILYIAKLRNYAISEVSVNWHNVPGSKVNVVVDSSKMLFEVINIYIRSLSGKYRPQES